ncbi:MAG: MBL fold metallo-hydrolase [Actinomycetaceae bacterium]|nr:MBL fold metallo-hydrolase [Actinomycetaceae bacterium]
MKLTILGATGSMSGPLGPASSYMVESANTRLVLDLGPGSFGRLWDYGAERLDALLFSHLHADHVSDIISLQVFRKWHPRRQFVPLPVYGPPGTLQRFAQIEGAAAGTTYGDEFVFTPFTVGGQYQIGDFTVKTWRANHSADAYIMRLETRVDDRMVSLCYTGDTDACPQLVEAAADCDFLLSECGFTSSDQARGVHLDGRRAAEMAVAAHARKLVLTHIQPWTDPAVPVAEAEDYLANYEGDAPALLRGQVAVAKAGQVYQIA